jgi:hypothetical protein
MKRLAVAGLTFGLVAAVSSLALAQNTDARATKDRSANASDQKGKPQKGNTQGKDRSEPVVITLTTVTFAESTGCWARIHDGENFTGRTLTLMGAQSLPNLEFGVGSDWEGDIDSVEVGPKGKLVLYDDENFTDDPREIGPNGRIADLHQSLFDEGIESMKLSCTENANSQR